MIVKRIRMSTGKAVGASIKDLADYIKDADEKEKVLAYGARNFVTNDHDGNVAEMQALASAAARSAQPCVHYVLSWHEDEQPSDEQAAEAVAIFANELGLDDHQIIWAMHADTDNIHLHMLINRVHPEHERVTKINNGFDLEAAHKAVARIEDAQGWRAEHNARYAVIDGEVMRVKRSKEASEEKAIHAKARDFEARTGAKSAQRTAREDAKEILASAGSWQEMHARLAAVGMQLKKTAGGLTLQVGDEHIKASSVDRKASLKNLEKRLGPWEGPQQELHIKQREPQPVRPDLQRGEWQQYISARQQHYTARAAAQAELASKIDAERQELKIQQRAERAQLHDKDWSGKGEALNAVRSLLAAKQAAERAEMQDKHRQERAELRQKYPAYPDYETHLKRRHSDELAQEWRAREQINGFTGQWTDAGVRDIRSFQGERTHAGVSFARPGEDVAFVDKGERIEVVQSDDEQALLAAMQLSMSKWGHVRIDGSDEFKERCAAVAAKHNIRIDNPEMQEQIRTERQRIQSERDDMKKSEQLKAFEAYADAVGAERYRVTSIKMKANGDKMTFILDKKDGVTKGFSPDEIARRTTEMQRLQKRGENLYYTPLSEKKHHILIDDMSREKLDRLIKDGFKPAVVLESSPGNYQAIITVPKLGTPHDKDVGNRLSDRLNREYGDPKLSGAIHPHRAPGFENRKPKHQRDDGSYPAVRLLKAERRECDKTQELARSIDAEYQRQAQQKKDVQKGPQQAPQKGYSDARALERMKGGTAQEKAYAGHFAAIKRMYPDADMSRVDSMIAVRMKMTGHGGDDVRATIERCAPTIRPPEQQQRDWPDYADRTAKFTQSYQAQQQIRQLEKYAPQIWRCEGRDYAKEMMQQRQLELELEREREREYQRSRSMGMGM